MRMFFPTLAPRGACGPLLACAAAPANRIARTAVSKWTKIGRKRQDREPAHPQAPAIDHIRTVAAPPAARASSGAIESVGCLSFRPRATAREPEPRATRAGALLCQFWVPDISLARNSGMTAAVYEPN